MASPRWPRRSGIPAALPGIFPGREVLRWQPVERSLRGHVKAAVEMIERWTETANAGDVLPFKQVFKALGVTSHSFKHEVGSHPDFVGAVSELGVVECGKGKYYTGFTLRLIAVVTENFIRAGADLSIG